MPNCSSFSLNIYAPPGTQAVWNAICLLPSDFGLADSWILPLKILILSVECSSFPGLLDSFFPLKT